LDPTSSRSCLRFLNVNGTVAILQRLIAKHEVVSG
jgi:hypothetical protein